MTHNNAMSDVLERLYSLCGAQFGEETIANCYGVLIADLREEAYAQGWLDDSQSCQKALERGLRLIIVLESTTEPLQWTRSLSLVPVSSKTRRSRKRPTDHENIAEERAQKKSRRGSAKDNPDQRIQDGLGKLYKPRWTKEQKDWVVSTFPHGETD